MNPQGSKAINAFWGAQSQLIPEIVTSTFFSVDRFDPSLHSEATPAGLAVLSCALGAAPAYAAVSGFNQLHIDGNMKGVHSAAQNQAVQRAHVAVVSSPCQRHVAI